MVISDAYLYIFIVFILFIMTFVVTIMRTREIMLIHKFYFLAAVILIIWFLSLIGIKLLDTTEEWKIFPFDCITTSCAALIPACLLLFALCYILDDKKMPRRYIWIFAFPVLTSVMVSTNHLHHLYYTDFSLINTSVKFGPYFIIHCSYSVLCVVLAVYIIVKFAIKSKSKLHIWQASLFTIGSLIPSITNMLVLSKAVEANVTATPISFAITMVFHGLIIFRFHFFDIKPIAMQQLIKWFSDCYLVTNSSGIIVNFNQSFKDLLGACKIKENEYLYELVNDENIENKTIIYNLLAAIKSSQDTGSRVTYEQTVHMQKDNDIVKCFYMAEISPLISGGEACGSISVFKDITQIKVNMQRLQDSQVKMMEQERLAFLGQMMGGLAHNLKTPIMSISGGVSAVENLIKECDTSLDDNDVTVEDYKEIYQEMYGWLYRIRDACSYMSDIITAVKGQASNMNTSEKQDFLLDDAFRKVMLLLRHELINNNCNFKVENPFSEKAIILHGDINNLVQVLNNIVSNAIDAQKEDGNHDIIAGVDHDDKFLKIIIKDYGIGIPLKVRNNIFSRMVTSKGNMGTGLGIFISNSIIHAKFDGSMWFEDNPEGGTIWGISIPMENVDFIYRKGMVVNEEK